MKDPEAIKVNFLQSLIDTEKMNLLYEFLETSFPELLSNRVLKNEMVLYKNSYQGIAEMAKADFEKVFGNPSEVFHIDDEIPAEKEIVYVWDEENHYWLPAKHGQKTTNDDGQFYYFDMFNAHDDRWLDTKQFFRWTRLPFLKTYDKQQSNK